MKLTKKIIKLINEKTNCSIDEWKDKKGYTIYVDNTCGEDFTIEINKGQDELEDIINSCDGFDVDEHFGLWFGANNGEPSSAQVLLDNCREIGENLEQLSDLLKGLK